jgi:hypothetical protein
MEGMAPRKPKKRPAKSKPFTRKDMDDALKKVFRPGEPKQGHEPSSSRT